MRLGVLDVGSNTVHLLVVDGASGARPEPVRSHKTELRLAELLRADGSLGPRGTDALVAAVQDAHRAACEEGVDELLAFATSAVREAHDAAQVLDAVAERAGVQLEVLSGGDEARLTFLAVRRWFGWSAGRLTCLDIGGGSLEVAAGVDEGPEVALSVPLGGGRLTREHLPGDPPCRADIGRVRRLVRSVLEDALTPVVAAGPPDLAVGTSKTFRSLARLAGAAPYKEGPGVPRVLTRQALVRLEDDLAGTSVAERAQLPGVSLGRAPQLLAGAIVARNALEVLDLDELQICPWALREGIVLRRIDWLSEK